MNTPFGRNRPFLLILLTIHQLKHYKSSLRVLERIVLVYVRISPRLNF